MWRAVTGDHFRGSWVWRVVTGDHRRGSWVWRVVTEDRGRGYGQSVLSLLSSSVNNAEPTIEVLDLAVSLHSREAHVEVHVQEAVFPANQVYLYLDYSTETIDL